MVLYEMDLDLTCSEVVFQAATSQCCWDLWQRTTFCGFSSPRTFAISEVVQLLTQQDLDQETSIRLAGMSLLNLFTVISGKSWQRRFCADLTCHLGLHVVIFQQRNLGICLPVSLDPIGLAVKRWKIAWDAGQAMNEQQYGLEPWQETGFFIHASEYASLAMARLAALAPDYSAMSVIRATQLQRTKPVPERLDDTSMRQVTDLMLNLSFESSQDLFRTG